MRYELHCDKCKIKMNLLKEINTTEKYELDQYGNYISADSDSYYKLYLECPECGEKEEIKDNDFCYIQTVEVVKLFAKSHSDYTSSNGTELDGKLLGELMECK